MEFIKSKDGEKVTAVNRMGQGVAFISKNRFGTHGHWHGWRHNLYCPAKSQIIWAGVSATVVYPRQLYPEKEYGVTDRWTDAPVCFANIKEFKEYYENLEREPALPTRVIPGYEWKIESVKDFLFAMEFFNGNDFVADMSDSYYCTQEEKAEVSRQRRDVIRQASEKGLLKEELLK